MVTSPRDAVVCPDKFRGSLGAPEAAEAIARGLVRAGYDDARVARLPLADGGEGTIDALLAALGGARRHTTVTGPLGDPVDAGWAVLTGGVAVVEMASASGLALVGAAHNDPLRATTRGTGELIAAAARAGHRRVIVAVGGSATTDGGLAALDALGWSLAGLHVTVACDVTTTFLDAARVYGPQKGATAAQVQLLSRRLERLADTYRARTRVDVTTIPGSGAAGGLAGGLAAIGARLEPGFDVVANAIGLDEALEGAALVVTGEGKLDATSLEGKVVSGALDAASSAGVEHRAVVCGIATDDARAALVADGVTVRTLLERAWDEADAHTRAALLCEEAAVDVARARR